MGDFNTNRDIRATRKPHQCEQCGRMIATGSPAKYNSGSYDGEMYSQRFHVECWDAAHAYATLHGLWGEDWPWFAHGDGFTHEDQAWMRENHPIVADRLGWAMPGEDDE